MAGGSTAAANSGAFMGNRHSFHVSFHSMSAIKFDQIIVSVKEIQACRLGFFYCYRGFSSILNYHTSGDNIFFFQYSVEQMKLYFCNRIFQDNLQSFRFIFFCTDEWKTFQSVFSSCNFMCYVNWITALGTIRILYI